MERIQTLLRVRDGALPEYMLQHHPMAARLAEALLQNDPARRPGAAEVRIHPQRTYKALDAGTSLLTQCADTLESVTIAVTWLCQSDEFIMLMHDVRVCRC